MDQMQAAGIKVVLDIAVSPARFDGLGWVALFDQQDDPSNLNYGGIDPALQKAVNADTNWPSGDLFPVYGLPVRRAGAHRAYLPGAHR